MKPIIQRINQSINNEIIKREDTNSNQSKVIELA